MNLIKLTDQMNDSIVINLDTVTTIAVGFLKEAVFTFDNEKAINVKESFEDVISRLDFSDNNRAYLPDLQMKIDPLQYQPKL